MQKRLLVGVLVSWLASGWLIRVVPAQTLPDDEQLQARGLIVTRSPHLRLISDLRRDDIAEFNEVFEQAVEQWCDYFGVDPGRVADWQITACVMLELDRQKFLDAGLFPQDLPPFPAGFQRGPNIWLYVQDGEYYTRHLLIHEGTHAFMEQFLGGYGAPWYAEGMAELLGVHRWREGRLQINQQAETREAVPYWGRVKSVRSDRDAGLGRSLNDVMALPVDAFREVQAYGWAWAACQFFDKHPDFQSSFRQLAKQAALPAEEFNQQFLTTLRKQWPAACMQWENMVAEIDYGYDVAQAKPVPVTERQQTTAATKFKLAGDRGWQETGIRLTPGQRVLVQATGMYQVKQDTQPWPCDAEGVTLEYYRGLPLGRLLAAVQPDGDRAALNVLQVGTRGEVHSDSGGMLYLRINDSPSHWGDNRGSLNITVGPLSD